jgi:putative transposase
MKRKRHSEEQIAFALRQVELGTPVSDIVREMGLPNKRLAVEKEVWRARSR